MTMRDAARLLADVQRLADIGYWEWDVRTDRVTWSEELYRIFGVEADGFEATYRTYVQLLHPDDRDLVEDTVRRACGTGQDYSMEHRIVRPDGEVRWLLGRGTVELADGEVVRLFGTTSDITERKRAEIVLREFISHAAHELRTPISSIVSSVELLREGLGGDAAGTADEHAAGGVPAVVSGGPETDRDAVLAVLNRQVQRLREISDDLLDLNALETRTAPVMLAPRSVAPIVHRAVATAGVTPAMIEVSDPLVALAGEAELELILVHLLRNASQHGGPTVEVRAGSDGGDVVIVVADDGPGVPEELREAMFTPFTRGAANGGCGTGLGLAVARRLATMQRGSLDYRAAPAGGARFTVRLGAAT